MRFDRIESFVHIIHRNMFADLGHDVSAYTVSEDGTSFAKLVDAIYAPEAPLTTDCIDDLSGMLSGLCESIQFENCRCKLPGYGLIPFVCDGRVAAQVLHEAPARELLPLHQQHPIDSRKSASVAFSGQQIRLHVGIGALPEVHRNSPLRRNQQVQYQSTSS